jgi:hypothetical protein
MFKGFEIYQKYTLEDKSINSKVVSEKERMDAYVMALRMDKQESKYLQK